MPNAIDHEEAPRTGQVRIGIELEGVGSIAMSWSLPFPTIPTVADRQMFQATLKRSRLIRSGSFDAGRGVYLTPEEVTVSPNQGVLGRSHPAELVSSPHRLDVQNLEFLRASVEKALRNRQSPMIARAHHAEQRTTTMQLPQGHGGGQAVSSLDGAQVTATWGRAAGARIGRSLQTTVGVRVENLCSDNAQTRQRAITFLAATPAKQGRMLRLLEAAVAGQQALAADQITIGAMADARHRLRLVLLMYLADVCAPFLKGLGYEKDAYGCNIKGYSSFVGCGLANANDALRTAVREKARMDAIEHAATHGPEAVPNAAPLGQAAGHFQAGANAIANRLRDAMVGVLRNAGGEMTRPARALEQQFALEQIGQPGRSIQVVHERAPAIPCFVANNRLYTLIEARQAESSMNMNMGAFLRNEMTAQALLGRITAAIGT